MSTHTRGPSRIGARAPNLGLSIKPTAGGIHLLDATPTGVGPSGNRPDARTFAAAAVQLGRVLFGA
jgi:hypothetical protein